MTGPYPTGSGSTGSEASAARERHLDASGTTSQNQRDTLAYLRQRGSLGATQAELQTYLGVGHGTASQVLSTLHQREEVDRLVAKRLGSHVYVLPRFVLGRNLSGYRRLQSRQVLRQRILDLEQALEDLIRTEGAPNSTFETARRVLHDRLENR